MGDLYIKFVPERFTKIYLNWMENVRDWCISASCGGATRFPPGTATIVAI